MSKKEKFLSDRILDLINPTPVHFDPEADIHTETAAKVVDNDFDEDDLSDDGALSIFRKRNVQLIEEVDKRYAGKKVTRKSIGSFADKKKSKEPSSSGDDDDEQSSENEDVNSEDEDDNSEDEAEEKSENDKSEDDISAEESNGDESGSDGSEGGEDLSGVEVEDSDGEDDANVSRDFVHLATKDKGAEIDKGNAIRTQLSLWDGLLEARISLQKVLVAANKLPQPAEKDLFVAQGGREFTKAARSTQKAVSKLLDKLIDLREQRLKTNSEFKVIHGGSIGEVEAKNEADEEITSSEDEEKPKKESEPEETRPRLKRKLEDYATELTEQHSQFATYRNATIQRWNDKTRVSMGKLSGRDFSGFEQPTLKQVEQIMSNMPRLVARTRVKRAAFRTLGKPAAEAVDPTQPPPEEADREIFDDSDFYHVQLRELIERKTGSEPLGRQWLAVQAARSKMKRKCDTTSTKGRRLRYTPHAKLVSFMAPIPELPCNLDARNELYLSLFGAKRV